MRNGFGIVRDIAHGSRQQIELSVVSELLMIMKLAPYCVSYYRKRNGCGPDAPNASGGDALFSTREIVASISMMISRHIYERLICRFPHMTRPLHVGEIF